MYRNILIQIHHFRHKETEEMYKLVIADDESTIRNGMCKYIDWSSMGFVVVADFEDGTDTIEYLKKNSVDVVLADIQMSQKTGLDVAAFIQEQQLPVKIVIISGYKEFEYARKAIQYNVESYLLKPIQMEEVQSVFNNLKMELDASRPREEDDEEKKKFEEMLPELQEQFWLSLLIGAVHNKEDLMKKIDILKMELDPLAPYAILDVHMEESRAVTFYRMNENKRNLILNIFDSSNPEFIYYVVSFSNNITKVVATTHKIVDSEIFEKDLDKELTDKITSIAKLLQIKLEIRKEQVYSDIFGFESQKYAFQIHVTDDSGSIKIEEADYERLMQKYKMMVEIVNDGNFEELDEMLDNIFYECRNLPLNQIKQLLSNMLSVLSNKYLKMDNDLWIKMNKKLISKDIFATDSKEEVLSKCRVLLHDTMESVNRKENNASKEVVMHALEYIQKHYGEPISLEMVADRYFLNSSYFSRIFKQITGETFTDKLIEIRMEAAKNLLKNCRNRVYEISQMVGYTSEKYFYRVFKQYTGKSPVEYQRSKCLSDGKE